MKLLWVDCRKFNKKIITTSIESGANALLIDDKDKSRVKELGLIKIICNDISVDEQSDGDLLLGKDVEEIKIDSKSDEEKVLRSNASHIIIDTSDWKVIPIENLLSKCKGKKLIGKVKTVEEAKLALEIMEKGVDGILLLAEDLNTIKKVSSLITQGQGKINLVKAKITKITPLGMGDRVCVDTITNLPLGHGMLVGNSSSGMFLVYAENVETPYCATRPFRVNAGAVHAYIQMAQDKTKYLADLESGDEVQIIDPQGNLSTSFVGRIKVEKRPMMLVEAIFKGKKISLIMQNAETIRLTSPDGKPISITHLKKDDEVLVYLQEAGRHFGEKIEETITEK